VIGEDAAPLAQLKVTEDMFGAEGGKQEQARKWRL
jgi:hypothetical protein